MKNTFNISTILFLIILSFAAFLRMPTFTLPHDNGDQLFYTGLAMKLDKFGFPGYTLRNVDLRGNDFMLELSPAEEEKASLLKELEATGVTYYDEPLFHRSYGFPYALMLSHKVFSNSDPYITLRTTVRDQNKEVHSREADKTWYLQFYAAIIPFIFSILFILTVYILGKYLFSEKIALISAFLISISPIEILCSQKLWADTMLSFFVILSVLLFFLAKEKNNMALSFIAGLSSGIAVLVKQSGGFIVIAILVFHIWQNRANIFKLNELPRAVFDKHILIFIFGVFIVSFHWFYIVAQTYGHPLYSPPHYDIAERVSWFITLSKRPRYLYLAAIPYMVPVFALAYFAFLAGPFIRNFIDGKRAFMIIWALTFLAMLTFLNTKENRYMLPAYPAIAMLSADILQRIGSFLDRKFKRRLGDVFIVVIVITCAFWSVPIGVRHALVNLALILKPF